MARESFLINPVRRKVKRNIKRKTRSNAWPRAAAAHRKASKRGWNLRTRRKRGYAKPAGATYPRYNPFGEEVFIVGANPRRRTSRKRVTKRRKRRNPVRGLTKRNAWYGSSRKHAAAARKGWRKRSRSKSRRRARRNPARSTALSLGGINPMKPLTMLRPAIVGAAGYLVAERVPAMVGFPVGWAKTGVQAGVAVAGSMLLKRFLGKRDAIIFAIGSSIVIAKDLIEQYILSAIPGGAVSGVDAYTSEYEGPEGVGAYTSENIGTPYEDF